MRFTRPGRATAALAVAFAVVTAAIIALAALAGAAFLVLGVWVWLSRSDEDRRIPRELCQADQLLAEAHFGTSGAQDGLITLRAVKGEGPCLISSETSIRFLHDRNEPLSADIRQHKADYQIVIGRPGLTASDLARLSLPPKLDVEEQIDQSRSGAWILFTWRNWCANPRLGALKIAARMPDLTEVSTFVDNSIDANGNMMVPPCEKPEEPSSIDLGRGLRGEIVAQSSETCRAEQLSVNSDLFLLIPPDADYVRERRPERAIAGAWVLNDHKNACVLAKSRKVHLRDALGQDVDLRIKISRSREKEILVGPTNSHLRIDWTNWCAGVLQGPLSLTLEFADDRGSISWAIAASVDANGRVPAPPCLDEDDSSTFEVRTNF